MKYSHQDAVWILRMTVDSLVDDTLVLGVFTDYDEAAAHVVRLKNSNLKASDTDFALTMYPLNKINPDFAPPPAWD
jgi:hypothetical protein